MLIEPPTDNSSNGVETRSDNAKAMDFMLSGVRPLLIGWELGGFNQWPHPHLLSGTPVGFTQNQ